jgi:hypothetical protein
MARTLRHWWLLLLLGVGLSASARDIPKELWGKWRIARILPAQTVSCWGDKEEKAILGMEIEYRAQLLRWQTIEANHVDAEMREVTAEQFETQNSSPSASGSQVNFRQLGIRAASVRQVLIEHDDVQITGATTEVPGDDVLIKRKNVIVLSVCNVYFEAKRISTASR